jgi:hypothetical protein
VPRLQDVKENEAAAQSALSLMEIDADDVMQSSSEAEFMDESAMTAAGWKTTERKRAANRSSPTGSGTKGTP